MSCGLDDTVRTTSLASHVIGDNVFKAESQPKAFASAARGGLSVVALNDQLVVLRDGAKVSSLAVKYQPVSVALSVDGSQVAVGATDAIHLYTFAGSDLVAFKELTGTNRNQISALAYSPDGAYLAAADTSRQLVLHSTADYTVRTACTFDSPR